MRSLRYVSRTLSCDSHELYRMYYHCRQSKAEALLKEEALLIACSGNTYLHTHTHAVVIHTYTHTHTQW